MLFCRKRMSAFLASESCLPGLPPVAVGGKARAEGGGSGKATAEELVVASSREEL
jgi:hypothetical protein